jgi:hypothetical protein
MPNHFSLSVHNIFQISQDKNLKEDEIEIIEAETTKCIKLTVD